MNSSARLLWVYGAFSELRIGMLDDIRCSTGSELFVLATLGPGGLGRLYRIVEEIRR